jgi:23S rRNA pseudouridine2605 synthase
MAKQNNDNGRGRKFQDRQPGEKRSRTLNTSGDNRPTKDYKPRKEGTGDTPFGRTPRTEGGFGENRRNSPPRSGGRPFSSNRSDDGRFPKRNDGFNRDENSPRGRKPAGGYGDRPSSRPYSRNTERDGNNRDDRNPRDRRPASGYGDRPTGRPPFNRNTERDGNSRDDRSPRDRKPAGGYGDRPTGRPFNRNNEGEGNNRDERGRKPAGGYGDRPSSRPYSRNTERDGNNRDERGRKPAGGYGDRPSSRPYNRNTERDGNNRDERNTHDRNSGSGGYVRKGDNETSFGNSRPPRERREDSRPPRERRDDSRNERSGDSGPGKPFRKTAEPATSKRTVGRGPSKTRHVLEDKQRKSTRLGAPKNFKGNRRKHDDTGRDLEYANLLQGEEVRLNRYIANSGICSRREADVMIEQGLVFVNGTVANELGMKVQPGDEVKVDGRRITPEKPVYIILNKPKGYITSTSDPEGRATVMDLIDLQGKERIYPIGRLDRNTTGVLLLTNDGELAQKLMHPSFEIKKVYRVKLDRKPSKEHMLAWVSGIELEDGYMAFEQCGFVDKEEDDIVGVEIHSGRNRIVRRMFEHYGYEVEALDRVLLGDFDHVKLGRGKWRFLNEREIRYVERLKRKRPEKQKN